MNKLEQAARQALEALVRSNHGFRETPDKWPCAIEDNEEAITALREALAEQAEQEPVAYFLDVKAGFSSKHLYEQVSDEYKNDADVFPLYAAPVRTKDLTDDEISGSWYSTTSNIPAEGMMQQQRFARAVIAADREKNK